MRYRQCVGLWLVVLGACGSVQARQPDAGPDAAAPGESDPIDADPDPGPTLQITGTLREAGTQTPAGGATVDVIRISDQMRLATTSSGTDGAYAVLVPTHNAPFDAYLDVRHPGHLRTRAYLTPQLSSDSSADVIVFSSATLQDCAVAAGVSQPTSTGFVLAQLLESNQQAPGATAKVTPSGFVRYTDPSTQKPAGTRGATANDGLVWIFAVQPGTASVTGELADGVAVTSRQVRVEENLVIQVGLEP